MLKIASDLGKPQVGDDIVSVIAKKETYTYFVTPCYQNAVGMSRQGLRNKHFLPAVTQSGLFANIRIVPQMMTFQWIVQRESLDEVRLIDEEKMCRGALLLTCIQACIQRRRARK